MSQRRSKRALLSIAAVAALATLTGGCNWIGPGADASRSGFDPSTNALTPANVASLAQSFRTELDGGAGPPAVTRDGVFVSSNYTTTSLNRVTGALQWSTPMYFAGNSGVSARPGTVVMADPTNRRVLQTEQIDEIGVFHENRWLDARTGAVLEDQPDDADVTALRGSTVAGLKFHDTGTTIGGPTYKWMGGSGIDVPLTFNDMPDLQGPSDPTLGDNVVYFGFGQEVQAFDVPTSCPPVQLISGVPVPAPNTCPGRWRTAVDGFPAAPVLSPDGDTVYVATSHGFLYALNAGDGSVRWYRHLALWITKPPALANGTLYVPANEASIVALDAATGTTRWTAPTAVTQQPAVAGGVVYVAGANTLNAFDADGCGTDSCAASWSGSTGAGTTTGLAVLLDRVYVSTTTAVVGFAATASP